MASNFEDFFNFESNCSRKPTTVDHAKQRKDLEIAKQKIIPTDELINTFNLKTESLAQKERLLAASQEECKQIRINCDKMVENSFRLEKEKQKLTNANQALEKKYLDVLNCCEALKSHSNQLQMLFNERETELEGLKIENQLEKDNARDLQKTLASLIKKNENLTNHFRLLLNKPENRRLKKGNPEITSGNEKRKRIDIATSPLTVIQSISRATSPIIIDDRNSLTKLDKAISPINITILDKASSAVKKTSNEIATSPITVQNTSTRIIHDCETNLEERECLELNNSNNLTDSDSDCEVQTILKKMRMTHKLISPIPKTPTYESVLL